MNATLPEHTESVRLRLAPDDRPVIADLLESKGFGYLAAQLRPETRGPARWARCTIEIKRRNGTTRTRDTWGVRCPAGYTTGETVEVVSRKGERKLVTLGDVIKCDPRGYTIRKCAEVLA